MSVASEEEAVSLYHDLVYICAKDGFLLTRRRSNRSDVLTAIPKSHRAKDMKSLDMDQDLLPAGEVIDVKW